MAGRGNLHAGHRKRMRKRLAENGIESFEEHEMLEMLLYASHTRGNTNEIAHELIKTFGSLANVFNADIDSLQKIDGVGVSTATLLHLQGKLTSSYMRSLFQNTSAQMTGVDVGNYVCSLFAGHEHHEILYILCFDDEGRLLGSDIIRQGSMRYIHLDSRNVIDIAFKRKASMVVMAHNHPGGNPIPSPDDVNATRIIELGLNSIEVVLWDHLVIARGGFVSLVGDIGYQRMYG